MEGTTKPDQRSLTQVPGVLASGPPALREELSSLTGWSVDEVVNRLFRPGVLETIRIPSLGGAEITVRPGTSDVFVLRDTFVGLYHLPPPEMEPRVILDLGSHIGTTIAHFAYLYKKVRVFGVELDAENVELCARNITVWGDRCHVLHAAIAATDGISRYNRRVGNEWGFRIGSGSSPVRTVSIEKVLDHFGLREIDYVKMDIEGAEREVLRSGDRWSERVRSLKVEVHRPYTVEAAFEDLVNLGFSCQRDDRHWACVVARRPRRDHAISRPGSSN